MGNPSANDGSIVRADLDGRNPDDDRPDGRRSRRSSSRSRRERKLHWSDREGMRVAARESRRLIIETLVQTVRVTATDGISGLVRGYRRRSRRGKLYWTQRRRERRTGRSARKPRAPRGRPPRAGGDVECCSTGCRSHRSTSISSEGNAVLDRPRRSAPATASTERRSTVAPRKSDPEVLFTHLMEGIGLALDIPGGHVHHRPRWVGHSAQSRQLERQVSRHGQGNLTGIASPSSLA